MNIKNERGDVLLVTIVLVAAVAVLVLIVSDSFRAGLVTNQKSQSIDILQVVEESLVGAIENDWSWKQTVAANAAMSCLVTDGSVCPIAAQPVVVRLADNSILGGGAAGDPSGFDYLGNTCTGFNSSTPSDECPFKFVITWTPICPAGTCPPTLLSTLTGLAIQPQVRIDVSLLYSGTNKTVDMINFDMRFKKNFVRGSLEGTLAAACRSAGGDFNAQTQKCTFQSRQCLPNQVLVGFEQSGVPVCVTNRFLDNGCGAGFAPVEIEHGGRLKCWKF